jgi:hypothetical protein
VNIFNQRLCKYRESQLHCFLRSLRRRMSSMNSEEMIFQIQVKANEQLMKWDAKFKKLEERHTRGLKRSRRLINYDAFELAGGPSPTQGTSEDEPSSPSHSGSSGSQHDVNACSSGSKVLEVQAPVDIITTRAVSFEPKSMGAKLNFALRASQWWPGEVR